MRGQDVGKCVNEEKNRDVQLSPEPFTIDAMLSEDNMFRWNQNLACSDLQQKRPQAERGSKKSQETTEHDNKHVCKYSRERASKREGERERYAFEFQFSFNTNFFEILITEIC